MPLQIINLPIVGNATSSAQVETLLTCPHCFEKLAFSPVNISTFDRRVGESFAVSLRCLVCQQYAIFEYHIKNLDITYSGTSTHPYTTSLVKYNYNLQIEVTLPEHIEQVSSEFVSIYKQAAMAEAYGLYDVCGLGYRKSAEFLIKDYAIRLNPDKIDKIKSQPLSQTIKTYLSDFPKLQTLSTATSWLGNDEAHYIRKHTDKDLSDLKRFIIAAATFIAADFDADTALDFVSK